MPPRSVPDNSTILGAAAEHYVMSQLLRRQMIAALAPAGVPDADIIVSNRLGSALAAIQVKARRAIGADGGWSMSSKHERIVRDLLFYCFVDFGPPGIFDQIPVCWIVPSGIVARVLKITYDAWLAMPGARGQPHNPSDFRRLRPDYSDLKVPDLGKGWLDQYRESWEQIARASEISN
jgi:hypothetical protein